ncbi:hypothetical protein Tco_0949560 [Tanacetum coccineum]
MGEAKPQICWTFQSVGKGWSLLVALQSLNVISELRWVSHNTFHVSNLKKCYADEPLVVPLDGLHIDEKLQFVEEPVEIMDREVKRLKQNRIPIIKVRWNSRRDIVMSDSEDSTVTYTEAPPSLDYVPGLEETEQAPPLLEFVPEPIYPEFMPPEDKVFLAEEQPLSAAISPTTDSPGYIADSDPEEDEEDPEKDPTNYPADGRYNDDESSNDDEDDDDVEEDEDEEEEKHPAPVDSIPPPVHRVTTRMSVRAQTPISLPSDTEVARLLAIPTPPPSRLSPLSSPLPQIQSPLPHILSPPLHVSSPPLPASPTYPLGYRAAMIRLRSETPSTSHPLPSST